MDDETAYIRRELDVVRAVSVARQIASQQGFSSVEQSMIATAVSELGTNIVKYADRGYITISRIKEKTQMGIEVIAEDHGPGISDCTAALQDEVSSGTTLGIGLPGVKRLMDEFFMDSALGFGVKVVVRKWGVSR